MALTVVSSQKKNARTVAVTIEGPDPESVNDVTARQFAITAALEHMAQPALRRSNGVRPYFPDGTPHQGNGALPAGAVWRQTFELEAGL